MMNKLPIIVLVVLILLGVYSWNSDNPNISLRELLFPGTPIMHIGEIPIRVEIANSKEERTQGLSGRKELGSVDGLLFVFPDVDYHGIWMKDMKFPIDIIWISEDLNVVTIIRGVTPETYPRSFRPTRPAKYVLETNVHYADTFGLSEGQKVRLPVEYLDN